MNRFTDFRLHYNGNSDGYWSWPRLSARESVSAFHCHWNKRGGRGRGRRGRFMDGQMSGDSGHENRDFLLPGLVFSWTSGKQALPSPVQGNPTRLTTSYDTCTPIDRPRSIVGILNFFASFHRLRCRLESVKIELAPLPRWILLNRCRATVTDPMGIQWESTGTRV